VDRLGDLARYENVRAYRRKRCQRVNSAQNFGCGTLVADENESKCSMHRVSVGQTVTLRIQDAIDGLELTGQIEEVHKENGVVEVVFESITDAVGIDSSLLQPRLRGLDSA
jgi:hypothetical protein